MIWRPPRPTLFPYTTLFRSAVVPQLVQVAADGGGAPTRLSLIPPGADCQGVAQGEGGEVTPGRSRHHTDVLEQPGRLLDGYEWQVEVRRIAPGELRGPTPARAPDHHRHRSLHRFRQRRRVDQRIVPALMGEPLADGSLPEPGDDGQLLLEPVEPLAHRLGEWDAVCRVLPLRPARAKPELDPSA